MVLSERGISTRIVNILARNNINTLADLLTYKKREIGELSGIGKRAIQELSDYIIELGLNFAPDPYAAYNCFRHDRPYWDAKNRFFFLCDDCIPLFKLALNNHEPTSQLPPIEGTCSQCNKHLEKVTPTWWVLCEVCNRVANSIGRGVESQRYVKNKMIELFTDFDGINEISIDDCDLPILNTLVIDENEEENNNEISPDLKVKINGLTSFYIEVKTGQSSIGNTSIGPNMNRFQLDHQDIDCVQQFISSYNLPVFVFHVQCISRIDGATNRHEPIQCWWATTDTLRENYIESKQRPRETKSAAYFNIDAFRNISEIIDFFESEVYLNWKDSCSRGETTQIYQE